MDLLRVFMFQCKNILEDETCQYFVDNYYFIDYKVSCSKFMDDCDLRLRK